MLSTKRLTPILLAVFLLLATIFFLNTPSHPSIPLGSKDAAVEAPHNGNGQKPGNVPATVEVKPALGVAPPSGDSKSEAAGTKPSAPAVKDKKPAVSKGPVTYDKTTPPTVGCEDIVHDLQRRIIEAYQTQLKGIRYANIFGYLETENKGDAAIWSAQQILLSMMGINFMEACRFTDKECDLAKYRGALEAHKGHSAILIAGGGNFNDFYWEDQPSRMKMVETFPDFPIRSFPQSVYMTHEDRIEATKKAFGSHSDLQLAARDQPSFDWLENTFGPNAQGVQPNKVRRILTPDIAFMWGSRPDFRINTNKTHNILILARDDWEVSSGDSSAIPMGPGEFDLGGLVGKVTYNKVDWKFTNTPDINPTVITNADGTTTTVGEKEEGKNQRAWAKAIAGFEMLGSADFIITDRLHGHIMSTLIGTPHVLMDSKLKKNLNFHDTWTKDCGCTRVADNIEEAKNFARMFFENKKKEAAKGHA